MVGLAQAGHAAVVAHQEGPPGLAVVLVLRTLGHVSLVDAAVVVQQHARYVYAIGAGHAVLTVVAGYDGVTQVEFRYLLQEGVVFLRQWLQRGVSAQVVLQVFHIGHATQHGEHAGPSAREAERPRGDAAFRLSLPETGHEIVGQIAQPASQEGLHDHGGNTSLLQLPIEVDGIGVSVVHLLGVLPVHVVKLYLHKVPLVFVVLGEQIIKHLHVSMIGKTQVADAPGFTFLEQEVQHAVVQVALMEVFHAASSHAVQEHVVDVIHLQFLEGVMVHGKGTLSGLRLGREVGELGGYIVALAGMPAQGDAHGPLREALAIGGGSVKIVHAMLDGVVHLAVDHLLVYLLLLVTHLLGGQAHAAISQEGDFLLGLGILPIGHLAQGDGAGLLAWLAR